MLLNYEIDIEVSWKTQNIICGKAKSHSKQTSIFEALHSGT